MPAELSRSIWLVTSLSTGSGERMSKHAVPGGDIASLLRRFFELKEKGRRRMRKDFPIVVIQEAGLEGSGFTGCWYRKALRAISSTQLRL